MTTHVDSPVRPPETTPTPSQVVSRVRRSATRRYRLVIGVLVVLIVLAFAGSLILGRTVYPPAEVWAVILGEDVDGASFTVGTLRLPRATLALMAGLCFGMGGVTFQTMLRNPLASPDIIGISAGASTGAAIAIVIFSLPASGVFTVAITSGLAVALIVYALSRSRMSSGAGTRLILVGIGVAAMLESATTYVLSRAGQWDLQEVSRWLTGSLNGASWDGTRWVIGAFVVFAPILLGFSRHLSALQLGDDTAAALGTRPERTRLAAIVAAVGLIAFATAAAGPIAFVAFLSGPIAARLVNSSRSLLVPAALVGALLVLVADFVGQYAFGTRYPVGVITGVLGAPYLLYLIVRSNRRGGTL